MVRQWPNAPQISYPHPPPTESIRTNPKNAKVVEMEGRMGCDRPRRGNRWSLIRLTALSLWLTACSGTPAKADAAPAAPPVAAADAPATKAAGTSEYVIGA